jgi:hypothetical protein
MMTIHDHFIAAAFTGLLATNRKPIPGQTFASCHDILMNEAIKLGEEMVTKMYAARLEEMEAELARDATDRGLAHANAPSSTAEDKLEMIRTAYNAHGTSASILRNIRKILDE